MLVFTDGSCYHKTRLGGLGVYIIYDDGREGFISEGYQDTTISRMEGCAVLRALQVLKRTLPASYNKEVNLYSDSEYIIKSLNEGRHIRWQMIGWEGVANITMWKSILKVLHSLTFKVKFNHIRGHQSDLDNVLIFGNNMADLLSDYKNFKEYKSCKELCLQEL